METLTINVLGSPEVVHGASPVRGFVSSKAAALVYYLAVSGRAHAREALAGLLWPEVPDSQALKNLRDVLSNIHRLIDVQITITRQTVEINPDAVTLDSRRFETLVEAANHAASIADADGLLRDAVLLYKGDFLEGFAVTNAPAFEEWQLFEREQLRQLLLEALETLADHAATTSDGRVGIPYAARLLALDPLREAAHRLMMRLLASTGQRAAALAQYAACRRVLDEELGVDPDEETQALHKQILDGTITRHITSPLPSIRPVYHIPAPLTTLFGRAAEIAQATAWLCSPDCRLLSLVGIGGIGKTSLAIEIAHQLLPVSRQAEQFPHGIAFVDLSVVEARVAQARVESQESFAPLVVAVADALSLTFAGSDTPLAQLTNYLREKDLLLIFDNCEHLPHAADFIITLLRAAPKITIMATSRVRLDVRGEQIVALEGLAFPINQPASRCADGEHYSALQLFRRVAQSVDFQRRWTTNDDTAATRICALLNGLPLGIELAASLTRLMTCVEVEQAINANLAVLDSTRRDLPDRHRSLQAVFDHSWRLLSDAEQRVLRQLSVFRGGFSRAAAEEVAGASVMLLAALLDQSLVRRVSADEADVARYDLLDLVRRYAAERLAAPEATDELVSSYARHGRYYLGYLIQRTAALRSSRQQAALAEIHGEIENIRAAWHWACVQAQIDLLGQAADGMFYIYEMRSRFQEGSELFAQAALHLSRSQAISTSQITLVRSKLLARQGWLAFQAGHQSEGRALLAQSLESLRAIDAHAESIFSLNYLAAATYHGGDYHAATQLAEQALQTSEQCGDQHGMAVAKTILGQIAFLIGHYADARRHSLESLAIEQTLGNRWGTVFTLTSLGRVAQALNEPLEAQRYFQEGLHIRQSMRDTRGVALCLSDLGDIAAGRGEYAESQWCYRESLALFNEIGNGADIAAALIKLGYNALALHETAAAHTHVVAALRAAWTSQSIPRTLDALAALATVLSRSQPPQAHILATFVATHPASVRASRDRAAAVLTQLSAANNLQPPAQEVSLEYLVTMLLAGHHETLQSG